MSVSPESVPHFSIVVTSSRKSPLTDLGRRYRKDFQETPASGLGISADARKVEGGGVVLGGDREGVTSKIEGAVDAHGWLLLELPQTLGGAFVHHQVQGLV